MSTARAARHPELGDLIATAQVRFTGVPARKTRFVADLIRGLTVGQAQQQLLNIHRPSGVTIVSRALKSVVANAREKEAENPEALIVGEIFADAGPIIKRFQPRAMGRACKIRKRMSHLTIKLYAQA